ncbi:MAG TPA: hypothetical protein VHZ55_23200 [Bryobacteraceae bacterium]|nr:hypothetical protein [Bryobacteraceae bacterium]
MKVRLLADANLNQKIVTGLLIRDLEIDFELPQALIPEKMKDPEVLISMPDAFSSALKSAFALGSRVVHIENEISDLNR